MADSTAPGARCAYRSVVSMSLWPRASITARIEAPLITKREANVCRSTWRPRFGSLAALSTRSNNRSAWRFVIPPRTDAGAGNEGHLGPLQDDNLTARGGRNQTIRPPRNADVGRVSLLSSMIAGRPSDDLDREESTRLVLVSMSCPMADCRNCWYPKFGPSSAGSDSPPPSVIRLRQ
jgi:hypothetical protein